MSLRPAVGTCVRAAAVAPRTSKLAWMRCVRRAPGAVRPVPALPPLATRAVSTEQAPRVVRDERAETGAPKSGKLLAQYIGPARKLYYRLKLFSLTSLSVSALFAPVFLFATSKLEMAARVAIVATTLGASSVSTALISWIGAPYVGHMSLRRCHTDSEPLHYVSEGASDVVLDDTPSDPSVHAGDGYYLEIATLNWRMRSIKTTVYSPALLRTTSRPFASWAPPAPPQPLPVDTNATPTETEDTAAQLVAETVDVPSKRVIGRWWARWRVFPQEAKGLVEFDGTCDAEGRPVRHFYVDEQQLGDEWRVLG